MENLSRQSNRRDESIAWIFWVVAGRVEGEPQSVLYEVGGTRQEKESGVDVGRLTVSKKCKKNGPALFPINPAVQNQKVLYVIFGKLRISRKTTGKNPGPF